MQCVRFAAKECSTEITSSNKLTFRWFANNGNNQSFLKCELKKEIGIITPAVCRCPEHLPINTFQVGMDSSFSPLWNGQLIAIEIKWAEVIKQIPTPHQEMFPLYYLSHSGFICFLNSLYIPVDLLVIDKLQTILAGRRKYLCPLHVLWCWASDVRKTQKVQLFMCHVGTKTVNTEALSPAFDKLMCQQAETLQLPHGCTLHWTCPHWEPYSVE